MFVYSVRRALLYLRFRAFYGVEHGAEFRGIGASRTGALEEFRAQ